jgi:thioredoxin reductase
MSNHPNPDVVIVGGGAAGLSAALVLGRARADVVLVDAGQPSNSPATGIGGLLGHDGTPPSHFYEQAREELAGYPTVLRRSGTVTAIRRGEAPRWRLNLGDAGGLGTDRIVLATGMRYAVPDIEGIEPRWGSSVFHCPFCHGWEHRDQPLAVLGGPGDTERALLLRRWTDDLTLVTTGSELSDTERHRLERAGIRVVAGPIAALQGTGRDLSAILLSDGTAIPATGLLVPAPHRYRDASLLDGLGLDTTPAGHLVTDAFGRTSVAGIWAAGDLTGPVGSVARAIAEGSGCAAAVTRDLVETRHGL